MTMSRYFFGTLLVSLLFGACTTNNVTVDNSLGRYFDSAGVRGDFGFFDNGQGHFTIYNLARFRDSTYSPGATFELVQSLIAIQTGAALPLGKDTLKKWVDSLHYGNRDISDAGDSARPYPRLRITSDEQLGLTKKLYFDQLPFFQHTQKTVRGTFTAEKNSNYQLVYKTSQADDGAGHAFGWVLGWVEENRHPYFFVLNMESADTTRRLDSVGVQMVKKIMASMGFFQGTK